MDSVEKLIVRQRLLEKFDQPAYSLCDIERIFSRMGLGIFSGDKLRYPAKGRNENELNLFIPKEQLTDLRISKRQKGFGYILRSNVKTLAERLETEIPFDYSNFDVAVQELGFYVEVER